MSFAIADYLKAREAPVRVPALPKSIHFRSYYLHAAHDFDSLMQFADEELAGVDFDTLVGTGLSGTIVAPMLARHLGKHFLIVRKDNDGSHSDIPAEGTLGQRWVFVDDFIDTGMTLGRVWNKIQTLCEERLFISEFVGVAQYSKCRYDDLSYWKIHDALEYHKSFAEGGSAYDGRYEPATCQTW
ncbi:phosphoribosyltransferase [Mycobacteroides abscessus]|uniref:phosphoribosyltransferase n=1 Tax=Mycobacteroides abscessus TaxID=36809 RepID=UPI000C257911|nr:phosphoribosyltransferase [Mycobacteroides abscessus]